MLSRYSNEIVAFYGFIKGWFLDVRGMINRKRIEGCVEFVKTFMQYCIGGYILAFVFIKGYMFLGFPVFDLPFVNLEPVDYILKKNILSLVSEAMMVSAAIELAYMLYTPGPDEAVDPLILGIAGTALLVMSDDNKVSGDGFLSDSFSVLLFVISLSLLFFLRYKLTTWFPKEFGSSDSEQGTTNVQSTLDNNNSDVTGMTLQASKKDAA